MKREYSVLLYGPTGAEQPMTVAEDLASAILLELAGGGRVEPWQVLRLRNRYFCDGAVLGAKEFVERVFKANRDQFGPKRSSGARRMRGIELGGLHVLRGLRSRILG